MRTTLLAAAGATAWALPALAPVVPGLAAALRVPLRLCDGSPAVALTFDDGPHPQGTPAVLDVLAEYDVTATFFMIGEQVRRCPSVAREVVAAGHAVGLHGQTHRNLLRLTPRMFRADLDSAEATLAEATGIRPVLYRPPYGILTAGALVELRRRGLAPMLWSRWGRDWAATATPASVAETVCCGVAAGDVLLLHDADDYSAPGSWRVTASALPDVLGRIAGAGLLTGALQP